MKATENLKQEHESIKMMLKIIEQIVISHKNTKTLNKEHFEWVLEFLKGFVDKCHHGKEEEILFPALVEHGMSKNAGPVAVMLYEHQQGRNLVKTLSTAFEEFENEVNQSVDTIISGSESYVDILRNHIEKENDILFMMSDRILSDIEQSAIFNAFENLEEERIGPGKHEQYHQILRDLKNIYIH